VLIEGESYMTPPSFTVKGPGITLQNGDAKLLCSCFNVILIKYTKIESITSPILNIIPFTILFCIIENKVIKNITSIGAVKEIY
jgi:hypothetical protein